MKTFLLVIGTLITSIVSTLGVLNLSSHTTKPSLTSSPITSPLPSLAPKQTSVTTTKENLITCLGPDGKTAKMTRQACYDLGQKWGKPVRILDDIQSPVSVQGASTIAKNHVCKVLSNGSIYYTKDANECNEYLNEELTRSLKGENCKNKSDGNLSACLSPCNQTYEVGRTVCAIAYTTENATIANDTAKYSECLDENSAIWQACTRPCYDKSISNFNSCLSN